MIIEKLLITGSSGLLGQAIEKCASKQNLRCICPSRCEMDITDINAIDRVFRTSSPDVVIHCAAWTCVDKAEEEINRQIVYAINVEGTKNIAIACKKYDCTMVYISSDYVFDGLGEKPWREDEVSCAPVNYYGMTKYQGEIISKNIVNKLYIIRTSWLFGYGGKNFVDTILAAAKSNDFLYVVDDQIGMPTYTDDFSEVLFEILNKCEFGTYHVTNSGEYISWAQFAREIVIRANLPSIVIPITTSEMIYSHVKRPLNSRLSISKILSEDFRTIPTWKDALSRYLLKIGGLNK